MASVDVNTSMLVTGRLSYGCTDLGTAWPHGGTGLGVVVSIYFAPPSGYSALQQEETNSTAAVIYTGGDAILGVGVESWDDDVGDDVLTKLFQNSSTSTTIYTLTVGTGASGSETATTTLDGTEFTTAITSGTAADVAAEIAADSFTGWTAAQVGSTAVVTFTKSTTAKDSGTDFTFESATATATFVETTRGGKEVMEWPGSDLAVGNVLTALDSLVFTPRNQEDHPAILIHKAMPLIAPTAQLRLSAYRWLTVPALFIGVPDGTNRVAQMGHIKALTL